MEKDKRQHVWHLFGKMVRLGMFRQLKRKAAVATRYVLGERKSSSVIVLDFYRQERMFIIFN